MSTSKLPMDLQSLLLLALEQLTALQHHGRLSRPELDAFAHHVVRNSDWKKEDIDWFVEISLALLEGNSRFEKRRSVS